MGVQSWIIRVAGLAMLAFLGFYVYGLVLGVFSPFELVGFTVLAVVFTVLVALQLRRTRRAIRDPDDPAHAEITGVAQKQREKRGF